ncbi:MAG: PVC-type heme-binding CxxCH protein [Fimbriiglobus sp.]
MVTLTRGLLAGCLFLLFAPLALAQKQFGFDNRKPSGQPYLTPQETVAKMKVAPEFEVKLFAGEPDCVNPVAFSIDERGRVWVLECFEYPSKTPKGKAPRDRIVILEDTDGDGACDKRTIFAEGKDFPITPERKKDGLPAFDLATGLEIGHGGVYVGAPPYIWFIENKDDKPGKFETLAGGFGSQDTHETLNTFQWGPDGWLYGMQGVFTQSTVKPLDGPETRMNAAVWRLHPKTKKFEIYAEGTSNPWGMDWRNTDGQFILACCVIPHLFHIVPGGIYKRQAGASYNSYAYGYINEISDHTFHKESGWAHAGLISLDAPHIPEKYRNSVIFGSIHGCSLKQNILAPNGSSYKATRGDDFLVSGDKNVRPINLKWGPHGDIYLIDWHDQNPCHQAAADSWDYARGRVYRIEVKGRKGGKAEDLGKKSNNQLLELTKDPRPYTNRTAFRLLAERLVADDDSASRFTSKMLADKSTTQNALRLRVLSVTDLKISENDVDTFIVKDTPAVQNTVARLIPAAVFQTDEIGQTIELLANQAKQTDNVNLRRELASVAVRIVEKHDVTPLVRALMSHTEDANDPLIPHLTWLAYEKVIAKKQGAASAAEKELKWLAEEAPKNIFVRDQIVPKVMRRLTATGQPRDLELCLEFIRDSADVNVREKALDGLAIGLAGQTVKAPELWAKVRDEITASKNPKLVTYINKLSVSFRDEAALKRAFEMVQPASISEIRAEGLRQMAQLRHTETQKLITKTLTEGEKPGPFLTEAARQLASLDDPNLGETIVSQWKQIPEAVRPEVIASLSSRKPWAKAMLVGLEKQTIDRKLISDNTIIRIQAFNDADMNKLIEKAWGRTRPTPTELLKMINDMRTELSTGTGSYVRGKAVFENQCAKCHKFEGRGQDVGPLLDGAARDIEYLLANIIDPNRVIGAPYFLRIANMADGRVEQGVLAEEDDNFLTLKVENGVLKKLAKKEIDSQKTVEKSMMPEGLTASMTKQDFRDLVRYVMQSPYFPEVKLSGKTVPTPTGGILKWTTTGDVTLEASFEITDTTATTLLVGLRGEYCILLDGKEIAVGVSDKFAIDGISLPVTLPKGQHEFKIEIKKPGQEASLRILDPERRLRFVEGK